MAGPHVGPLGSGDPETLGRYRLIGRLASGGMGRIYLARGAGGRLVAVKTLLSEGVVSEVDRRRFTREVSLAQRIDSEFTARVRDADPRAELPWMAIDYIAAPSLSELVRSEGVLPASAVRWLAAGTAEALVTLHGEGVIHRDLKPQNILLPLAGPRVIDFGISHASDLTLTSVTLGTIAFTSPEQARGEQSTEASDVYSLGATLFQMALGRPPYRADSGTLALLAQVQRGEVDLDGLPDELVPLIRPCLAVDPARRPLPAEMLERFRRSLAGLPVTQGGRHWLPRRWTELIRAYERHGREVARGADPGHAEDVTVDRSTGAGAAPGTTREYTQERGPAGREDPEPEREEDGAEGRRPEREQVRLVQQRLREQERQQELERRRAEETRRDAERKAREKAERKAGRRRAKAEERARQHASVTSSGSWPAASGVALASPRPEPARAPAPAPSGNGSSAMSWLVVLAVAALVLWLVGRPDTGAGADPGGAGPGTSATPVDDGATGTGPRTGTGAPGPSPVPTPDAQDEAFGAVASGDCLTASDDGYGNWSTEVPETVGCDASGAHLRVTSTHEGTRSADCPSGSGRSHWTHPGSAPGFGLTLCVERQFRVGQCFVSKHEGDRMADARLMTVWDCGKNTVPQGYDVILKITSLWRAQSTYPPGFCSQGGDDREDYWRFEVNDDRSVLCVRWV
ncbi:protein kinase [Streptomyces sp. NPDC006296]|uniref:protein kinase domain-containing protein n=1 Tax=Streptomyces sp. NPDC006296 TaxID=3156746 RepID=UPI0033B47F23